MYILTPRCFTILFNVDFLTSYLQSSYVLPPIAGYIPSPPPHPPPLLPSPLVHMQSHNLPLTSIQTPSSQSSPTNYATPSTSGTNGSAAHTPKSPLAATTAAPSPGSSDKSTAASSSSSSLSSRKETGPDGKSNPRKKTHFKSRNGCFVCKRRKIKVCLILYKRNVMSRY